MAKRWTVGALVSLAFLLIVAVTIWLLLPVVRSSLPFKDLAFSYDSLAPSTNDGDRVDLLLEMHAQAASAREQLMVLKRAYYLLDESPGLDSEVEEQLIGTQGIFQAALERFPGNQLIAQLNFLFYDDSVEYLSFSTDPLIEASYSLLAPDSSSIDLGGLENSSILGELGTMVYNAGIHGLIDGDSSSVGPLFTRHWQSLPPEGVDGLVFAIEALPPSLAKAMEETAANVPDSPLYAGLLRRSLDRAVAQGNFSDFQNTFNTLLQINPSLSDHLLRFRLGREAPPEAPYAYTDPRNLELIGFVSQKDKHSSLFGPESTSLYDSIAALLDTTMAQGEITENQWEVAMNLAAQFADWPRLELFVDSYQVQSDEHGDFLQFYRGLLMVREGRGAEALQLFLGMSKAPYRRASQFNIALLQGNVEQLMTLDLGNDPLMGDGILFSTQESKRVRGIVDRYRL